jgi:xanthine dehydrogenase YagR molybdenum-binding subunit
MARYLGKETTRVDGLAKVTGKAKYTAEFQIPNVSYGFIVLSTATKGRITAIDTREAEQAGGVIRVFTHLNAGKLGPAPGSRCAAGVVVAAAVGPRVLQRPADRAGRGRDLRASDDTQRAW